MFGSKKKIHRGRFKCRTCLYETPYEWKIRKHTRICKTGNKEEIGLEYDIMSCRNTPHTHLCPLCHKGFKSYDSRKLHFESCARNKKRKKCNTPIIYCRKCGKSFLMKTAADRHYELCKGGNDIRGGFQKTKKINEKQIGVVRKTVELEITDLDISSISRIIYDNTLGTIVSILKNSDVKIWSIFEFWMMKNEGKSDEEIFPIYFCTGTEQVSESGYFDMVLKWSEFALNCLDEWLENGSGAKFLKLSKCDVNIVEYKSDIGKGKSKKTGKIIPIDFYKKGRILHVTNIPSDDISCFHTCICAYDDIKSGKVNIEKSKTTRETRSKVGKILDYTEIDKSKFSQIVQLSSPFHFKDVKKMSKLLQPISFNIFKLVRNKNEVQIPGNSASNFHLVTAYLGKQAANKSNEEIVNLLYYGEHFYLILDLDNLVQFVKGKRNYHGKLCYNCLNSFDTRSGSFQTHQVTCSKGLKSNIVYCPPGTIQEFRRWSMLVPAVAYVVCDFESTLVPYSEKGGIPDDMYKNGKVLNIINKPEKDDFGIINRPRKNNFDSLHCCICAYYGIKKGKIILNNKKKSGSAIGKVLN